VIVVLALRGELDMNTTIHERSGWRSRRRRAACIVAALAMPFAVAASPPAHAADEVRIEGQFDDGTEYVIVKPANWNGVVIASLDAATRVNNSFYTALRADGYGIAGTKRQGDRAWVTQETDMERTLHAVTLWEAEFGEAETVLMYGRSAGGAAAISASEVAADRIDAAVALCAVNAFQVRNQIFDFIFTLRALIGPDDDTLRIDGFVPGTTTPASDRWQEVITEVGATPEGRARIALAFAMSEYPIYGAPTNTRGVPKPDFDDPEAVADAMVASALQIADRRIGNLLIFDADSAPAAAPPGTTRPQLYGNVGADYHEYWELTDPIYQDVTRSLYATAGLDLNAELDAVDAAPRVAFDDAGVQEQLTSQVESPRGLPEVPLFRVDNIGDQTFGPQAHQTHNDMVRNNGRSELYRTALVDNGGHCHNHPEQERAAIDVMMERLETGVWPATDAAAMNARVPEAAEDDRVYIEYPFTSFNGQWRFQDLTDVFNLPRAWDAGRAYDTGDRVVYDDSVFEALWWTRGLAPDANANGAWQRITLSVDGDDVWTESRIFREGDRVIHEGSQFEALWWTRGETPGESPTGAWQEIVLGDDGVVVWTPSRVFDTGDVVSHEGLEYRANWWNRNSDPAVSSAWTVLG
jgi:chitodextrinase